MVQEISEISIIHVENQRGSLKHDKECMKCCTKVEIGKKRPMEVWHLLHAYH